MYIKYYLRMIYKNKYVEKIYIVCDVDVVKYIFDLLVLCNVNNDCIVDIVLNFMYII